MNDPKLVAQIVSQLDSMDLPRGSCDCDECKQVITEAVLRYAGFESYGRWSHDRFTDEMCRDADEGDEIFWRPSPA